MRFLIDECLSGRLAVLLVDAGHDLTAWLAGQSQGFRDGIEAVAMDGFTGFKTAAADQLPAATAVMDPFHVVALAGEAVDRCQQRIQQDLHGHRGRSGDPLYGTRRVLRTGADLLTDRQHARLAALFTGDAHVQVEATWGIYQRIVTAYRDPNRAAGKTQLQAVIDSISRGVPTALTELRTLGRTLNRRAADVLAYFDRPGTSNGPTEAINGRLEHLRGTALGFPEPDQLHHPRTTRHRRLPPPPTPPSAMSPKRELWRRGCGSPECLIYPMLRPCHHGERVLESVA